MRKNEQKEGEKKDREKKRRIIKKRKTIGANGETVDLPPFVK